MPVAAARTLIRGLFKPFLLTKPGGDPDLYAIRHQSLRDMFKVEFSADSVDERVREICYDLRAAAQEAHQRIAIALIPPADQRGREWAHIDEYTRRHLPEHAAAAGVLDELVQDPVFMAVASIPELLQQRSNLKTMNGQDAVAVAELALSSWNTDLENRLSWMLVSSQKLNNEAQYQKILDVAIRYDIKWTPCGARSITGNLTAPSGAQRTRSSRPFLPNYARRHSADCHRRHSRCHPTLGYRS